MDSKFGCGVRKFVATFLKVHFEIRKPVCELSI